MPSSINSTSTSPGGIITTGATDNELVIQTGDTTAISIDASQNVTVAGDLTVNGTLGITGELPVANGGTGAATLTANNVILGNGTSAVQFVAPGASGNVLTSDGTTWTSAAGGGGGGGDYIKRTYTSPTTWTKPAGLKAVKVTVVGGGGGSGAEGSPASPLRVGANGGTSSFGGFASATGGAGGAGATPAPSLIGTNMQGGGGSASGGDINMRGFPAVAAPYSIRFQPGFYVRGSGLGGASSMGYSGYSTGITSPPANPENRNTSPTVAGSAGSGGSGANHGGGGGGTAIKYIPEVSIPGPVSVTVGAGGAPGTTGPSGPAPVLSPNNQAGNTGIVIVEEFY